MEPASINSVSPQRVVVITGAAGGLGQGLVKEFLAQGWRVVAGCHQQNPFADAENLWSLPLDITKAQSIQDTVQQIAAKWQRIDALINNAGITADNLLSKLGPADWDRVLEVNLKGAYLCAQAVLPVMLKQRGGHIINISSFSGRVGARGQANYTAAKAGLIGLTQSLAREVGGRNIRVNAVLPGLMPTSMTAGLTPDQFQAFAAANALKRLNTVAEVGRFVAFLATLENVSGQVFQLDSRIARWT